MYYKITPITENPEKGGYQLTNLGKVYFSLSKGWRVRTPDFWLKPVEGVLVDEAELHRLWVAARNYEVENRFGKVPNKHPDFNEYIKRFKQ